MRELAVRELGLLDYGRAFALQQDLVARRKRDEIPDQLLILEHPHVVTLGRNGHPENLLASLEVLERTGIAFHHSDRGGDVTYHGPGQIVAYPIMDLREWRRDVGAYVRAIERTLIETVAAFGIAAESLPGLTGVWCGGAKIAAIGIHISRWVTSHGFALNLNTDLKYFQYIVPCGLAKPVTSLAALGVTAPRREVIDVLTGNFRRNFDFEETWDDRRSDAPDGREYRRRYADQMAEKAGGHRRAGRTAIRDFDR